MFFEQSVFHTWLAAVPAFRHDSDPVEYNPPDRTTGTAVDHDVRRTLYINLDESHK